MAEDKKGFVLYKSWIKPIKELDNKECGILFLNILSFVNGEELNKAMMSHTQELYNNITNQIEYEWSKFNTKTNKYHWNYKGGITDDNKIIRNSTSYKYWRTSVFKRDDYTCQKCGLFGGELNAHHLKHFATHPELRTELSNGITLCKTCHKKEHENV